MNLPLYSQDEYQRLHVQTAVWTGDKCNECVGFNASPDISINQNTGKPVTAGNGSEPFTPLVDHISEYGIKIFIFMLVFVYILLVICIARYKPHTDILAMKN